MAENSPNLPPIFTGSSTPTGARLEFCFAIRIKFANIQMLGDMPSGAARGAVYIADGTIDGPRLKGRVLKDSGGDWSLFRPDGVLAMDARYMLEADDGTLILLHNRGYLWGRTPDVMPRMRAWMFDGGPAVHFDEFYLRSAPTFEVAKGKHDWLMRHVFVGVGDRFPDGNIIRYFALL